MEKKKVFEETMDIVVEKIKNGIWRPGQKLPALLKLAEELNVGVSTLREVLRILESKRIITIEHGRGMFIRKDMMYSNSQQEKLNSDSLIKLFEARHLLEPEFAFLAAQRAFIHELDEISRSAEKIAKHIERYESFVEEDVHFHYLIAQAAHSDILFNMFQSLEEQLLEVRKYTNLIPGTVEKAAQYHVLIAQAIKNREPERARLLMKSHLDDTISELSLTKPTVAHG
ncbi:FCD domain-containing protein [Priestia aryabhattai]|uniref:FadR/GntR family transcriptional regulator n=1 Tax=Priestia aryabhattai TaxID=412384 RepID=UPI001C0E7CCD|nr:FCD domain-containing protein [Priestia aryabhattai]MBU3569938.1 FadR family transcriptional regulator [Priestia aryabhattai]WDL87736.1 FCD domain-containing protein [Priestia aryabhattai]